AFVLLKKTLPEEAKALTEIIGQKNAFAHLASHGSEDDRMAVVLRLRNLLADPVTTQLLADRSGPWVEEAKRRYAAVAEDDARRAREQNERTGEAEKKAREERQRAEAEARRAEAERVAREEAE